MHAETRGASGPSMLAHHEGIEENLRFLIHEVRKQLVATRDYLQTPTLLEHEGFWDKDDYIDNLKNVILRKCFARVTRTAQEDEATVALLKAIDVVTVNLERIADFCEDIVVQTRHVEPSVLLRHDFTPFFAHILAAIDRIEEALLRSDATRALEICRAEEVADHLYAGWLQRIQQELKAGKDVESHVSILFISHYLERMGDSLLNIGEAVLSACLGERIKMEEFRVLEGFLGAEGLQHSLVDIALEPVAETRSGCRINRIRPRRSAGEGALMIFKEGRLDKLLAEKEGATRWEEILPGLVPRIHAFHHHGDNGSILFEYLPGHTFEELLLRGDSQATAEALALLCRTLESVWRRTRTEEPVAPRFVEQLRRRLKDVYALHPAFRTSRRGIGKLEVRSFDGLVEALRHLDERLQCPFSVFTHGDCNIDNIILRHGEPRVHFVDLHRSRMGDWLQDVSVFLVSNFRLQVLDGQVRRRVQEVVLRFHGFAADLAPQLGDTTFAPRLALGLARSLATSTRFVLDPGFAKDLFLRARHLLEELIVTPDERLSGFEIPGEVLFD